MNEHQPWEFTCATCGGHKLTVYRVWNILAGPESESWQEWGLLEADHTWVFKFKEKVEKDNDDEIERGDFGESANLAGRDPTVAGAYFPLNVLTSFPGNIGPSPDIWIPGKRRVGSQSEMTMSENKNVVEIHGCIVCAKLFDILAVYAADGRLVDCVVTSPGGHIVPDKQRPLVACDTHTEEEIESAHNRWQSTNSKEFDNEQEDE